MEPGNNSLLGQMAGGFPAERIARLIDSLMNASYISGHSLGGMTIEDLGNRLFEEKQTFVDSNSIPTAESNDLEKCIHDYCLLLQELESDGMRDFSGQTLAELQGAQTKTRFLKAVPDLADVLEGKNTILDWGNQSSETPKAPIEESPFHESEPAATTDWMKDSNDVTSVGALAEPDEIPIMMPIEDPAPNSSPEASLSQALEGTGDPHDKEEVTTSSLFPPETLEDFSDKSEVQKETHTNFELSPPLPETILEEEVQATPDLPTIQTPNEDSISRWIELPKKEKESVTDHGLAPMPEEATPLLSIKDEKNHPATDLWKSGEEIARTAGIPREHQLRSGAMFFCLSVEKNLHNVFTTPLFNAWQERSIPIVTSLDTEHRRFDLKPSLKSFLDDLCEAHPQWLFDGKLPLSGVINSLRYLLATEDTEKLRPSLLDWGVIFFWFGGNAERGGVKLVNLLGLKNFEDAKLFEAMFRLFRMNKLRMRALTVVQEFGEEHFAQLKEDGLRLREILNGIELGEAEAIFDKAD